LGEKDPPAVRAGAAAFVEFDRAVPGQERAGFEGAVAGPAAVRAWPRPIGGLGLLRGGLLAEAARQPLAGLVRALLDGGEIEPCRGAIVSEELLRQLREEALDLGIVLEAGG
jgi:hypothetical protein